MGYKSYIDSAIAKIEIKLKESHNTLEWIDREKLEKV